MITVVADDLTGAAEMAGVCLRYGITVSFGIDTLPETSAEVTIVATDSRSMSENDAYNIHNQLAEKILQRSPNHIIFKKCDSVLRGHVLTELSALMTVFTKSSVLLQPSNPHGNRCIQNGIYYVNETEIAKTSFNTDPDFPAKTSNVKQLLSNRSSIGNTIEIHTGRISKINSKGIFIPDCKNEKDLIENLKLFSNDILIGGSAAFFQQFLVKLTLASSKKSTEKLHFSSNYLLVSGSTHSESIAFSEMLQKQNCPMLKFPKVLLKEVIDEENLNAWTQEVSETYNKHKKLGLRISNDVISFKNSSKILKNRLSFVVKSFLKQSNCNELFFEGGATTYDVLKMLEWHSFTPIAELRLGVVRMQYNHNPKTHITLKPGSYNWPTGLIN